MSECSAESRLSIIRVRVSFNADDPPYFDRAPKRCPKWQSFDAPEELLERYERAYIEYRDAEDALEALRVAALRAVA